MLCGNLVRINLVVPLRGDHQPVAVRSDGLAKGTGIGGEVLVQQNGPRLIENAQIHGSGVQIDAAVESVLLLIETHQLLLWHGSGA